MLRGRLHGGAWNCIKFASRSEQGANRRFIHLPDADGKLTGGDAVKFFERSGLPRDTLAKVSPSVVLLTPSTVFVLFALTGQVGC